VDKLTPELLPKAFKATLAIQDAASRAKGLNSLVNKVPEALPKALEAALAVEHESDYQEAFSILADKLTLEHCPLPKFLEAAQAMQNCSYRAAALTAYAVHLVNDLNCFNFWKALLHFLSHRTRPDLLSDLTALSPVIVALGGESAATETVQAIQDVARWWK
jgi:hypothetical protein